MRKVESRADFDANNRWAQSKTISRLEIDFGMGADDDQAGVW
jgi:hypothetical protein